MNNFQIGDEVILLSKFNYEIKRGSVGHVNKICNDENVAYPIGVIFPHSPITFYFAEYELQKVEKKEGQKEMTIHDLKPGMVIEYVNGKKRLVIPNCDTKGLYLTGLDGSNHISDYTEDMKSKTCPEDLTINKIFISKYTTNLKMLLTDGFGLELIWERKPKPKEMTMEELEKTLGYPIKIVKEKDLTPTLLLKEIKEFNNNWDNVADEETNNAVIKAMKEKYNN